MEQPPDFLETSFNFSSPNFPLIRMVEDLLEFVIDVSLRLGAEYAEARYQKDLTETVILKNGVPQVSAKSIDEGICVRVLVDGTLGFASTVSLNKGSLRKIARAAYSMAKTSSRMRKSKIRLSEEDLSKAAVELKTRIRFEAVDLDAKVDFLKEVDKVVLEAGERFGVKVSSRLFEIGRMDTEKRVVNSDGADIYMSVPRSFFEYFLTLYSPQHGSLQRFQHLGESRGWEAIEAWNLLEKLPEEVERISSILVHGESPSQKIVDVVLGPEVVGIACHESAGHPGEADRVLGREAAQGGESYIKPELLGSKIGSDLVTIVDDPSIPRSFGYSPYDDEGVKGRERKLIENGTLKELLHNRETAAEFGVKSNGAARSAGFDYEPIIRMSTTYMKPGDYSFEELLEDIKDGVYIKSYQEWNIDDKRWNQRYVGVEAYRIIDGEIRDPVKAPILELTTREFYSSIDAIGKKVRFFAGYCGKGDPMQGVPVWMGGPHVRLRGVRLGVRPS